MPFSPSQSTTWIFFPLKVREFVFIELNGSEHVCPSLRLNMQLICLPAQMYVGDSSCHHSLSEQLTCGLSVSVEKKPKKQKTTEAAGVFECLSMCVCGPHGFPEIHQQSGFASVSFTPLLCGTGCLWLPLPIGHGRTQLSDFDIAFIVTKELLHHLQIWTYFFHCFSLGNNPDSLYNALTIAVHYIVHSVYPTVHREEKCTSDAP